jgi:UDP-glucose 4-epimerase
LTVVSPGSQKRYFTHIDDVVLGLKMIGEHGHGDNYCLCDQNSLFSIMELAKMFSENIEMIPSQNGDRVDLQVPSGKCSDEFGWSTSKNISDYIEKIKGEIK